MNKIVTSREELLKAAKQIVLENGEEGLSIRGLAQKCGIAVGSVYNYFPSKAELLLAVTEDFWKAVFHAGLCGGEGDTDFLLFLQDVYEGLYQNFSKFHTVLLGQLGGLPGEDISKGKQLMEQYLQHMREGFLCVLRQDKKILPAVWTESFPPQKLVSFLFSNMLAMLTAGEKDGRYLIEVARRLLYL